LLEKFALFRLLTIRSACSRVVAIQNTDFITFIPSLLNRKHAVESKALADLFTLDFVVWRSLFGAYKLRSDLRAPHASLC
jgi:hypothetical protein